MFEPFVDMIADFMVCSNYKDSFNPPLKILPLSDSADFNLVTQLACWLDISPDLINIVAKDLGDVDESDPIGMCELLDNGGARISYSNNINLCWKRFVVVKELVHLILRKVDYDNYSLDTRELLSSVCNAESASMIGVYNINTPRGSNELVAWFFACQLLVPWFKHQEIIDSSESNYALAERYRSPLMLIEWIKDETEIHISLGNEIKHACIRRLSSIAK